MNGIIRWAFWASLAGGVPLFAQMGTASASSCKCTPRPYSATFKITTVQTLGDGTTITRESTEIGARDSAGRWMTSNTQHLQGPVGREFTSGSVRDPVAGTETTWNSMNHQATVLQLPPPEERHGCWADAEGHLRMSYQSNTPRPGSNAARTTTKPAGGGGGAATVITAVRSANRDSAQREDLGTSTIMGVEVHGTRNTFTTPAEAIGNDRPIVRVMENWWAPSLGMMLRSVTDDPRSGRTTREVQSLDLGEPPVSMFQPPEDYKVIAQQLHQVDCPSQH